MTDEREEQFLKYFKVIQGIIGSGRLELFCWAASKDEAKAKFRRSYGERVKQDEKIYVIKLKG